MAKPQKNYILYDGTIEPDLPLNELIIWYCQRIEQKLDQALAKPKTEPLCS